MTHIERLQELIRRYVGFNPDFPEAPEHGLCSNCMRVQPIGSDDAEDVLREDIIKPIHARWPGFTGNPRYPVEGNREYYRNADKYNPETEFGRARRDLRLFIIAELQRMLADETGLQSGLHSQPGGRATEDKA